MSRGGSARPVIDLDDFARLRGELAGSGEPNGFPRLRELLAADQGSVTWRVRGERRPRPEGGSDAYLTLRLQGELRVTCIRCLQPVAVSIDEERLFRITATESLAERFDAESDECDALAADPAFDVLALIEDEAILALPIAPRHADCALPVDATADPPVTTARPNPFAVLGKLKAAGGEGQGA